MEMLVTFIQVKFINISNFPTFFSTICTGFDVCCNNGPNFSGGPVIGKAVAALRQTIKPTSEVEMEAASQVVDMGLTNLNLTLERIDNCTQVRKLLLLFEFF